MSLFPLKVGAFTWLPLASLCWWCDASSMLSTGVTQASQSENTWGGEGFLLKAFSYLLLALGIFVVEQLFTVKKKT